MFETGKYYICKKCKEVNNKELNEFITNVFYTSHKSATNKAYLRSYSGGNSNYYDYYEPQVMMKFHIGCIYKCTLGDYLIDDNGQLVYIGNLDGFLFEEIKINLNGCEKIIGAIKKHYGCSASVKPWTVNDEIGTVYVCNVKLHSVNGKYFASGCSFSANPVNGLLAAYRDARKTLAQSGKLNRAIHRDNDSYIYTYKFL